MVFKTKFRMKFRFTCAHFVCIFVCSFHRHHPALHLKVVIIFFHPLLGSFFFALKIFVFFTLIFVVKCNEMRKKIRDVFFSTRYMYIHVVYNSRTLWGFLQFLDGYVAHVFKLLFGPNLDCISRNEIKCTQQQQNAIALTATKILNGTKAHQQQQPNETG